jgi:hypothetical protein
MNFKSSTLRRHFLPGASMTLTVRFTSPRVTVSIWHVTVTLVCEYSDTNTLLPRMLLAVALLPVPAFPTRTRVISAAGQVQGSTQSPPPIADLCSSKRNNTIISKRDLVVMTYDFIRRSKQEATRNGGQSSRGSQPVCLPSRMNGAWPAGAARNGVNESPSWWSGGSNG